MSLYDVYVLLLRISYMDAIRAIRVQREVFDELNPAHEDSRIVAFI
jgi:hypothetical protein